jgi:hypothetical protein
MMEQTVYPMLPLRRCRRECCAALPLSLPFSCRGRCAPPHPPCPPHASPRLCVLPPLYSDAAARRSITACCLGRGKAQARGLQPHRCMPANTNPGASTRHMRRRGKGWGQSKREGMRYWRHASLCACPAPGEGAWEPPWTWPGSSVRFGKRQAPVHLLNQCAACTEGQGRCATPPRPQQAPRAPTRTRAR